MFLRFLSIVMAAKTCSKDLSAFSFGHGKSPCFSEVTFLSLVCPDYSLIILPCVDGKKTWSVHSEMEETENVVQNHKKKRSQSDKIGRLKYNQQLLKQTQSEVEEVKLMLRTIFAGLKGSFCFDRSLIERIACVDEIDREIVDLLLEAGKPGLLPKDLQVKLERFKVTRHQISRRIIRMNRRLEKEFGEHVAEKRGWHWALTSFAFENWADNENGNSDKKP